MFRWIATTLLAGLVVAPALAEEEEGFKVLEHEVMRQAVGKAKWTAKQAIEAAGKDAGAAKLLEMAIGMKGDTPIFEVAFLTDAAVKQITLDAVSGKVLETEEEKPDADEADERKPMQNALGEAKTTLAQAIDTAMNEVKGGVVVQAAAEVEDGKLQFNVELIAGDAFKQVEIAADGKVKKVKDALGEGQAWTFDRESAGKPPAGWKFGFTNTAGGKATWTLAKDEKAMSGPNVLTLSAESESATFNLALAPKTSYKDVDVRTRLRPNTGKEDQGGGLVWRCKDENNYYICRMNPLESNFRVYKVVAGKRQQLQGVEAKTEAGKWHVVRAKMVGNHIMCWLGEKKLLDVTDDEFKDAGMIGLWTKADASSSFDNIAVRTGKAGKQDQVAAKPADAGKKAGKGDDDDDDDDDDDSAKKPEAGKVKP